MSDLRPFPVGDFTGGLASIFPMSKMPSKFSTRLRNCHVTAGGGIGKIPGYEKLNTTTLTDIQKSVYEYQNSAGEIVKLCAGNGKIYKFNTGTDEFDVIKTGLDVDAIVRFCFVNDVCIITNGVDVPLKYGQGVVDFTSGGTYEVVVGNTIEGATSGATAVVADIVLDSGTWAGGDAAGHFHVKNQTGTFQAENLDVGANPNVATIAADADYTPQTLAGSPPTTAFKALAHKGRIWMIERTDRMIATHSALNKVEDYTTGSDAGYLDFRFVLKKGDELIDIASYVDLLVFFFKDHVLIYSGTNPTAAGDFALVQKIEGTGVVGTDTIFPVGTDLAFLAPSGVKTLQQIVSTGALSIGNATKYIAPTILQAIEDNPTGPYGAAYYKPLGWFFLLIGTVIYLYDINKKAWATMEGADVYGIYGSISGEVYIAGTGFVYQYGTGYDFAGTDITWIWGTAWLKFTRTAREVHCKRLKVIVQDGATTEVTVQAIYDEVISGPDNIATIQLDSGGSLMDEPVTDIWENVFFMDDGGDDPQEVPMFGSGSFMKLEFSNTSDVGPQEISDLTIYATVGGR